MSELELKSCPFCGGKARLVTDTDRQAPAFDWTFPAYQIVCQGCGCGTMRVLKNLFYGENSEDIENLVNIWNKRVNENGRDGG